jgi:dTDP-4-amino-4,6-dideoxygalactose transaminase
VVAAPVATTWLTTLPPLPVTAWGRRPVGEAEAPWPLGDPRLRIFARGRHALFHGVRALGLGQGDAVLVPAYHHGSEVEALLRAGLEVRFYDATPALEPDAAELEALLGPSVRALHLTHFLGWPQDMARWRAWCDDRGLVLLEDAAPAFLASRDGRPVGSAGDLAIWSVYKTIAVPDGGALVVSPPRGPRRHGPRLVGDVARLHAATLARRSRALSRIARPAPVAYDPAADFSLGDPSRAPSRLTLHLLPRLAQHDVAARRRARARALAARLGGRVPEPFATVPDGASPMGLPVCSDDPGALIAQLRRAGVHSVRLWQAPHPTLDADRHPRAKALREGLVMLPAHHGMAGEDVERVVAAMEGAP